MIAGFLKLLATIGIGIAESATAVPHLTPTLPSEEPPQVVLKAGQPAPAPAPAQFMSTIQVAIFEPHPEMMQRSQRVVLEQLNQTLSASPQLQGRHAEIRTSGNEVVLYLVTEQDMRRPMQQAVSDMILNLNGRVRARGRSLYYRTSPSRPLDGYLEVVVNDKHSKVHSIAAQSVPLRDLLKEMKSRLGGLSYLVPGECADRLVDWSFGLGATAPGRSVDAVMGDLATLFGLKSEKKRGTYIFSGNCNKEPEKGHIVPAAGERVPQPHFFARPIPDQALQVYFPLSPLGN